ncbi:MAG: hypothetical protein ABIJ46_01460 [bacterium]
MISQSTLDGLKAIIAVIALLVIASLAAITGSGCAVHNGQIDANSALEMAQADAPADAEVEARPSGDARARLEQIARAYNAQVSCPEGASFCEVVYTVYTPVEEDESSASWRDSAFTVVPAVAESIVTVRSVGQSHLVRIWTDPAAAPIL